MLSEEPPPPYDSVVADYPAQKIALVFIAFIFGFVTGIIVGTMIVSG
jgi:hypothetical protein